jgi:hypothetical protein
MKSGESFAGPIRNFSATMICFLGSTATVCFR